jgi:hypothetical protein
VTTVREHGSAMSQISCGTHGEKVAGWVVVIGSGVWAKYYGLFTSHDAVMAWVRANQFDVEDAHAYPVNSIAES